VKKWFYLTAYAIPSLVLCGAALGGIYHFLTPVVVFGLVPLLDLVIGTDPRNEDEATYKRRRDQAFYRFVTWSFLPVQIAMVVWGAWLVTSGRLSTLETVGFVLSIGIVSGGLGITIAHELGHRSNRLEQNLAKGLLWTVSYMHFFIEHNQGHHARVATPNDPASARLGESFYRFYPRTLFGSWRSAWSLEKRRLTKRNLPVWSHHNQMIWFTLLPLLTTGALGIVFGPGAALFFIVQSWIAFTLLEIINYVEHYGLSRNRVGPGKYQKVAPCHSWNSSEVLTNYLLFHLQRHSDHHANANRRYQTLRHFGDAPQLPTGYAGMVLLALFPPLWRRVMDPRVARVSATP